MPKYLLVFSLCAVLGIVHAQNEPFALGADISWVQQRENPASAGGGNVQYYHNGQARDMLDILKENGFNYIRLRLFVDPTVEVPEDRDVQRDWYASPYSTRGYCGLDSTIKYAKKVKAAGMKFLLDFHYSDTWADPGKQYKPVSWRGLNFTELTARVRSYTRESLEAFRDNDVLPDMVQVGNEVINGMIHPDGRSWASGGVGGWPSFARLVHAGINGVKDVDQNILIMMHTVADASPSPNSWLTSLKTNLNTIEAGFGNRIDVFGISYYPRWHGDLNTLQGQLNAVANNHDIKISIVEYADFHREVNDMVFALPNNKGFGTFVWEPQEFAGDNSVPLFDWRNSPSGRHSNARLLLYPQMAIDYGLTASSSSSRPPSSSSVTPSSSSVAPSSSSATTITCTLPAGLVAGTNVNAAAQRGYLRCSNTGNAPTTGSPTWNGNPRAPFNGTTVAAAGNYTGITVTANCGLGATSVSGTCNNIAIAAASSSSSIAPSSSSANSFTCTGLVATGTVGTAITAPTVRCNGTTVTNNLTWTPTGRVPTAAGTLAVSVSRGNATGTGNACAGMTALCGNVSVSAAPSSSSIAPSSSSSLASSSSAAAPSSSSFNGASSSSSSSSEAGSSSSAGSTPIIAVNNQTPFHIYTTGNYIILENLPANSKVEIYNLGGKLIYATSSSANSGKMKIPVQAKGMYVVKVGSTPPLLLPLLP
ncbi:MAG: glycosyl hydrolase 53 family protein [Fibromonadaceae bacterium]|nr:glycosyl hydrolase 53 family protein [Fibromonadaceae bacterium]